MTIGREAQTLMRSVGVTLLLGSSVAFSSVSLAADCWTATNINGYSAASDEKYQFTRDGLRNPAIVCFEGDRGTVTGTDTPLVRFGESTLIGFVKNTGLELVEVYQIDRANGKLLYSKSRIGTAGRSRQLPDIVLSFVGEAKQTR